MAKIISIGKAVPAYQHGQSQIQRFMEQIYAFNETDRRKLRFLYHQGGIDKRYSVIPDYSRPIGEWKFYPHSEGLEPFPSLEQRMVLYKKYAAPLSLDAIRNCLGTRFEPNTITHLITVSCTGMSAPGLDLEIMELLELPRTVFRTSINFMGCYAAIHGLKLAQLICEADPAAKVLLVCTELCTLHFQREANIDNIMSSLLFSDGSAAALITADQYPGRGIRLSGFYSEVLPRGKKDMAWELSSSGFLMTLSSYIPDLIEEDFEQLMRGALAYNRRSMEEVTHWCIHPGGKKILDIIEPILPPANGQPHLQDSYQVLREYGNMSSPSILFVLESIMHHLNYGKTNTIFGAAFGPGLTMETFLADSVCE